MAETASTTVEEITSIDLNTITITNTDITSVLIDETATVVNVVPDETYTITVAGNTEGNYDTSIVAFIDWNQNDVLDDENEVYTVGILTNSTGSDGVTISTDITVPSDAVLGSTRIRITKTYTDPDSTAIVDPCAISFDAFGFGAQAGFGQAVDFTLNIGTLSINEFDANALSVYPNPVKDVLNIAYKSELSDVKIYDLLGQEVISKKTSSSQLQLNTSTLETGIYMVKLLSENGQHSFRVIKE